MAQHATIDFETRSEVNLLKVGAYKYAEHPSTSILWMAYNLGGETKLWWHTDPDPEDLFEWVRNGGLIEAHGSFFEHCIWNIVATRDLMWPEMPIEQWRCSMAKCRYNSIPGSLEKAGATLGLNTQKDKRGKQLIKLLSVPQKVAKGKLKRWEKGNGLEEGSEAFHLIEISTGLSMIEYLEWRDGVMGVFEEDTFAWNNDPNLMEEFGDYCITDVDTEMELSSVLDEMPQSEIDIWLLDQKMNWRGIYIDLPAIHATLSILAQATEKYQNRLAKISGGAFTTGGQRDKIMGWCAKQGVMLPGFTKQDVSEALEEDIPPQVREVLEIRQILGKTSTAKYTEMLIKVSDVDGRIHEVLVYHKAHTGRWGGAGVQLQNLPRPTLNEDPEFLVELLMTGSLAEVEFWFENVYEVAACAIRSMIIPEPGKVYVSADYAAIEARILFLLAGEEYGLKVFRRGQCIYSDTAAEIYKTSYERIYNGYKAEQFEETIMRKMGKDSVLGLGFQMGAPKFVSTCAQNGTEIKLPFAKKVVNIYRTKYAQVPKLWKGLEKAAIKAMENPGIVFSYRAIKYKKVKRALLCRLPSGRCLHYPSATLELTTTSWGEDKMQIHYKTMEDGRWVTTNTYGGKLTENAVQAVSRDLMASGMLELDNNDMTPIMSVHDELVAEVPEGEEDLERFSECMCILPDWAKGLPLKAEGWVGYRYRK